jgi:hypothetical protein
LMCGVVLTSRNDAAGTTNLFENARREYRPSKIRLLIIAESPPSSGGFFYFPKTIGKDHLFRETMKTIGLWPQSASMPRGVDKNPMLRSFQSRGFYLLDSSRYPVDKMPNLARRKAIQDQLPRLAEDVKRADPLHIVIVKSSIFGPVKRTVEEAGFGSRVLHNRPVPFPSHGNQQKYRTMMKRLLDQTGVL